MVYSSDPWHFFIPDSHSFPWLLESLHGSVSSQCPRDFFLPHGCSLFSLAFSRVLPKAKPVQNDRVAKSSGLVHQQSCLWYQAGCIKQHQFLCGAAVETEFLSQLLINHLQSSWAGPFTWILFFVWEQICVDFGSWFFAWFLQAKMQATFGLGFELFRFLWWAGMLEALFFLEIKTLYCWYKHHPPSHKLYQYNEPSLLYPKKMLKKWGKCALVWKHKACL